MCIYIYIYIYIYIERERERERERTHIYRVMDGNCWGVCKKHPITMIFSIIY